VRRHLFDLVVLGAVATIVAGYIVAAQPGWRDVAAHVWIIVVGALLLGGLVASTGDTTPSLRSPLDRVLADRGRTESRPAEVARLEREVTLGAGAAYDLHYRLIPTLREIAWARLERTGRVPGPDTLGRWWELLRPDREPPSDRFARGIDERELRALVDDLEKM
jgi:hypothetical protein